MQLRRVSSFALTVALAYGAALILLAGTYAASRIVDRRVGDFSQDPAATLGGPAYIGYLTAVATILWSTAATSSLLAWLATGRSRRSPFLWSALFIAALLADDAFQLHEIYYPDLGLSQVAVAALYAAGGAAYLWFFRGFILANDALLFIVGLALLGTSIVTDQLVETGAPWVAEDAAKFLGIVSWVLFYVRAALHALPTVPARAGS